MKKLAVIKAEICGINAEKALTRAIRRGAKVYNVRRSDSLTLSFDISPFSFEKLKDCCSDADLKVIKRNGLSDIEQIKKLAVMLLTCMFAVVGSFVLSQRVIAIDVNGCESITTYEVRNALKEEGVDFFAAKNDIDLNSAKKNLQKKFSSIDLVNVYYEGARMKINIIEGPRKGKIEDSTPCDIVAADDGVIERLEVYSGEPCVERYMSVKKGDLLVRGNYVKNEKSFTVHSRAKIIASVDYIKTVRIKNCSEIKVKTGRETLVKYLKIGSLWVKIDKDEPYGSYTSEIINEKTFAVNTPLPISLCDIKLCETASGGDIENSEEIISAKECLYYECLKDIPKNAQIERVKGNVFFDGKDAVITVTVSALQDIGIQTDNMKVPEEEQKYVGEQSDQL